jgi:hypothetical protein
VAIHVDQSQPTGRLQQQTRFHSQSSLFQKHSPIHPLEAPDQVLHQRDQALLIHQLRDQASGQTDTALALLTHQEDHVTAIHQLRDQADHHIHQADETHEVDHLHTHHREHHMADHRLHMEQALDHQAPQRHEAHHIHQPRDLEVLLHTEDRRHLTELLHEEALLIHHRLGRLQGILQADTALADHHHHIHQEAEEVTHLAHHTADHEVAIQVTEEVTPQEVVAALAVAEEAHAEADEASISMSTSL